MSLRFQHLMVLMSLIFCFHVANAQVAINEDDSDADPKAALDIKSTTKGMLFPNLSETQRNNLPSPATGLMIFNRTVGYFNYYNGIKWCRIERTVVENPATTAGGAQTEIGVGIGIADPDNSAILHVNANNKGVLLPKLAADIGAPPTGIIYFNTTYNIIKWYNGAAWKVVGRIPQVSAASGAGTAEGVVIGGTTVDASAKLEIIPDGEQGLLIPRLSTAQRQAMVAPIAEGLLIYNTNTNELQYFTDNAWYKFNESDPEYGKVIGKPGMSCKDIIDINETTVGVNGNYYINPTGSSTFECYCDMTTNDGGWTLVVSYDVNPGGAAAGSTFVTQSVNRDPAVGNVTTDITVNSASWWTDLRWGPATNRSASWADVGFPVYNENTAALLTWLGKLGTGSIERVSPTTTYKCSWAAGYTTATGNATTIYNNLNFPNNNWNIPCIGAAASWTAYVPSVNTAGGVLGVLSRTQHTGGPDCNVGDNRRRYMQAWVR